MWTAKREWPDGKGSRTTLVAVTSPDCGCANFFLESSKPEDTAPIDSIARSFHPKAEPSPVRSVNDPRPDQLGQFLVTWANTV